MADPSARLSAIAFDAYGTLLDTVSATRRHATRIGPEWERFSQLWRTKQFEYTWVRSLAGPAQHADFARVVDHALAHAAGAHGIADTALLAELRDSFDHLEPFADVIPALRALRERGVRCAILSNGTPSMLAHQLRNAGLETLLDPVISVEEVGIFKPEPRVYAHAETRLGLSGGRLGFVSSNAWDVFGAHAFGLRPFWINRRGQPDEYGLRGRVPEAADLDGLLALLE